MELVYKTLLHTIMITGFVFVMMLVIEYINVQSKGLWQKFLAKNKWSQYLIAGLLGAIPGCLGAFTMVAMYSHRLVSFGALVTTMIATSGDESFVMFALIPKKAILLTLIIFVVGVLAGYITDKLYKPTKALEQISTHKLSLHNEPDCKCFEKDKIWFNLFHPSFHRIITSIIILILITGVSTGIIAGGLEIWMKISVLLAFLFSLFIVITVPNHFLKKHIWAHIVKKHLPRIFLWVFGTLLLMHFLMNYIDVQAWITSNMYVVLIIAILVGLIPESGPHLIFVTLFAQGSIPFSILLASSISQDGHGMLPMLAESRRTFLSVKIVNIIYAFIVGASTFLLGF
ncbi:putative manganese transporter [Lutibacter sp. A64]|uniref:putative manganese transporter n=1 Tax=Lutibacter sp. A64 TaxID=2918526 RepID=UPI001F05EFEF|nr:putative manganese transporter [Lutibacter sp. A64]UMB54246.1 putative manganese transporter [Lutibacter sp. A64]